MCVGKIVGVGFVEDARCVIEIESVVVDIRGKEGLEGLQRLQK